MHSDLRMQRVTPQSLLNAHKHSQPLHTTKSWHSTCFLLSLSPSGLERSKTHRCTGQEALETAVHISSPFTQKPPQPEAPETIFPLKPSEKLPRLQLQHDLRSLPPLVPDRRTR